MCLRRPILPIFSSLSNGSSISANMSPAVAAVWLTEVDNSDLCLRHVVTILRGIQQSSVQLCFTSTSIISKYKIYNCISNISPNCLILQFLYFKFFPPWQSFSGQADFLTSAAKSLMAAEDSDSKICLIYLSDFIKKIFLLFSVKLDLRSSETEISKNATGWLLLHLIDITLY